MKKAEDQMLIIFGASGDLTGRKLIASLFELHVRNLLPDHFCILGVSRTNYTDALFRVHQEDLFKELHPADTYSAKALKEFLKKIYYLPINTNEAASYSVLRERIFALRKLNKIPDRIIYYLATPPEMYPVIPRYLQENGLNVPLESTGWRRIVVEKPFGTSLESAVKLNRQLLSIFKEKDIYRIDHYLGKETVQNILALRFSNGIFEPLWNRNYIDSVEIIASETLGVENRGKYYEGAGALRDMVQNHLMQLMAFAAMEAPAQFETEAIRDEVVKVFRSVRRFSQEDREQFVLRGQYKGYTGEKNVSSDSFRETAVALRLFIDNWRWGGVPFYFLTGKKLPQKSSEIIIRFKSTPHQIFKEQSHISFCNKLIIHIEPDEGISLNFGLKVPGEQFKVEPVSMDFRYSSLRNVTLPDAYEHLLLDVMLGDSTLYARTDALEASWKLYDPVLELWQKIGKEGLFIYEPGQPFEWESKLQQSSCSIK